MLDDAARASLRLARLAAHLRKPATLDDIVTNLATVPRAARRTPGSVDNPDAPHTLAPVDTDGKPHA